LNICERHMLCACSDEVKVILPGHCITNDEA
jgi:hypothetical protein